MNEAIYIVTIAAVGRVIALPLYAWARGLYAFARRIEP